MGQGDSEVEALPTAYGLMIAFVTGVLGYVLWVSLKTLNFLVSAPWNSWTSSDSSEE